MQIKNVISLSNRLGRPITVFDTETTGLGPAEKTGIVDIAYLTIYPGGRIVGFETLINPSQAIQEGASKIHGIWPADVEYAPRFKDVADRLIEPFHRDSNHVISGFNSKSYDTPIILARLAECQAQVKSVDDVDHLDVRTIYTCGQRYKKGKLFEVAAEYGVKVDLAHRAMADIKTTVMVLDAMIDRHGVDHVLREAQFPGFYTSRSQHHQSAQARVSGQLPSVPNIRTTDLFSGLSEQPSSVAASTQSEVESEQDRQQRLGFDASASFRASKAILAAIKANPLVVFSDGVVSKMVVSDMQVHGVMHFSVSDVHASLSHMMKIKQVHSKHVRNDEVVDRILPIIKQAFDRVPEEIRLVKDGTPRLTPLLNQVERLCGFKVGFNQLIVALQELPVPLEDMDGSMSAVNPIPVYRSGGNNDIVR